MLAGGQSRRFGGLPKGLEVVGGERIVDRIAATLGVVCSRIVLGANDAAAADWLPGVEIVRDMRSSAGGLAGVEAALTQTGSDVLVAAWDMPFLSPALLESLLALASDAGADAVIPVSAPPRLEPFCAFYSRRVLPKLTSWLDAAGGGSAGSAQEFVRALPGVRLLDRPPSVPPDAWTRWFLSVNSPDDLARARALAVSPE